MKMITINNINLIVHNRLTNYLVIKDNKIIKVNQMLLFPDRIWILKRVKRIRIFNLMKLICCQINKLKKTL